MSKAQPLPKQRLSSKRVKRFERPAFTLARELSQAGSERFGSPMWFIRCLGGLVARKFVVERNHPESKREVPSDLPLWKGMRQLDRRMSNLEDKVEGEKRRKENNREPNILIRGSQ